MKVLLVGKGAREHALAWKISRSPLLGQLYLWPGHAAMAGLGEVLDLPESASHDELLAVGQRLGLDLVVCGPEAPLSEGLADAFATVGIPTFGPRQAVARLEASKSFAKSVMARAGIPTAAYEEARDAQRCQQLATAMLAEKGGVVLKASGLAAGKGVFVCRNEADLKNALAHLYQTDMRHAADVVVVEEILEGRECSYFSFIGAGGASRLGFAVDFKRLGDGDIGPNTGGMGCYAPVPWLPADAAEQVESQVIAPLLRVLAEDDLSYCGCLYVGLMWSPTMGPQVVEFNVRLGDPEAQVLAVYDDRDWLALMAAKAGLSVSAAQLAAALAPVAHDEKAVAIVMASQSYPYGRDASDAAALPLSLFQNEVPADTCRVFGASLKPSDAQHVRTGAGRVLTVTARARSFAEAGGRAYAKVRDIGAAWGGSQWRTDIAASVAEAH